MHSEVTRIRVLIYQSIRYLAGLLLRFGILAKDFIELSKLAYVDAAMREFSGQSKRPSVAWLVERTGLSKHEVRRLRSLVEADEVPDAIVFPRAKGLIFQRWFTEPEYLGPDGQPKALPHGPGAGSLVELVQESMPGSAPDDIIQGLFADGQVYAKAPGGILPTNRSLTSAPDAEGLWAMLRSALLPVCVTMHHNMSVSEWDKKWLQRTAYNWKIPVSRLPMLRHSLRESGAQLIRQADDLMAGLSDDELPEESLVGVGVFYFEETA